MTEQTLRGRRSGFFTPWSLKSWLGMALQYAEDDDRYWAAVTELRNYRSPEQLAWIVKASHSLNWRKRQLAVNMICQLRRPEDVNCSRDDIPGFSTIAEQVLSEGLRDSQWRVQASSLYGLGHYSVANCLPVMLTLIAHPEARMRHGLAFALGRYQEASAAEGLLQLMADSDEDVRNWATFSLGSLCDLDSPAIRAGLLNVSQDANPEIRGEALLGLAVRRAPEAKALIMTALLGEFHGSWPIDAAAILADRDLVPSLEKLREHPEIVSNSYFSSVLEEALTACSQGEAVNEEIRKT